MFYIRYEYLSESYPRFRVYKSRENEKVLPYVIHESFSDVVRQSEIYPKYQHFFMLDESRFAFFRFDVYETKAEKFTLQDLKQVIDEKTASTKKQHNVNGERIMAYVDTIYVNGEEKKYVIGETGEIFFRLYIMYLDKKSINTINSTYGNFFEIKNTTFIPESFHTLLFLRNSLKKDNFVLLYINETFCKAINVRNGFYESVETLNLGLSALKQMYKDNWIVQYWYKEFDVIESNPLAKSLVTETLQFYSQLFCKRLQEKNFVGNDVIVISPITKNVHFIDIFNAEYKKLNNNYIVPFHHSKLLETFDRERDPDDMDALILMNREEYIKRELWLQAVE
jgi:hypothetical protein